MHIRRTAVLSAAATALAIPAVFATAAHATPTTAPSPALAPAYTDCTFKLGPWELHTSALKIHTKPSTSSTVLGILYRGQSFHVNSYTSGATWVNVTDLSTKVRGWVSGQYLYREYNTCLD